MKVNIEKTFECELCHREYEREDLAIECEDKHYNKFKIGESVYVIV